MNFIFNTLDTWGTANVIVGSLTSSAENADSIDLRYLRSDAFITLASNGSISESGGDAAADLIAAGVLLSSVTGVGAASNALETQATFIEAETTSGGCKLA